MISLAPSRQNAHMDEFTYGPGIVVPFPPVEAYGAEGDATAQAYMENLCALEDELLALRSRVRNLGRSGDGKTHNDVRDIVTIRKLVTSAMGVLG